MSKERQKGYATYIHGVKGGERVSQEPAIEGADGR